MQARREPQRDSGARETIIEGPYHYLIPYAPISRSETLKASRGRKRGEGCPLTSRLGIWWSVVSSPSGVRGRNPDRKWILCIFQVRKKPSGTPFSVFLSDGRSPNVAGPGKTPPSPYPLSTGLTECYLEFTGMTCKNGTV